MQCSRPWMRAMPSPTLSTVPTSATSMSAVNPPSCSRRILVISSARISMPGPSCLLSARPGGARAGGGETPPQGGEVRAHGPVVGLAAHPHQEPPDELRVHAAAQLGGPGGPPRVAARARACASGKATAETASAETTPLAAFAMSA